MKYIKKFNESHVSLWELITYEEYLSYVGGDEFERSFYLVCIGVSYTTYILCDTIDGVISLFKYIIIQLPF